MSTEPRAAPEWFPFHSADGQFPFSPYTGASWPGSPRPPCRSGGNQEKNAVEDLPRS